MTIDSKAQANLLGLAQLRLSQRDSTVPLSREEIAQTVDGLYNWMPAWRNLTSRDAVLSDLYSNFSTFIGEESVLCSNDDHKLWVDGRRDQIKWKLWDRYRAYLIQKGIPHPAINALGRVTDRTLELLGDPESRDLFNRRGMVVGDVQSGKTSNYTGLICKAVDAGYKVIIVLAGLTNSLRSQTQVRLDEGFIGKVSVPLNESTSRFVGVGKIDPSVIIDWATDRTEKGDFNKRTARFGMHPGGRPLLLVVKKYGGVLDAVLEWIRTTGNTTDLHGPRFARMPLLVIDDEADQASVDTKEQEFNEGVADPNHEPSRINGRIRQILGRFDQVSYVGYTATPFANILIHPNAETGNEFQDLFPRDFIINISPPDSYVGPNRIFGTVADGETGEGDDGLPLLIKEVEDHAETLSRRETRGWMPPLHKKDHVPRHKGVDGIPPSLERAIECFALVIAARRARGQTCVHNSMLIHVSRFQDVQSRVVDQIHQARDSIVNAVRYGENEGMRSLRERWESDFAPVTATLALPDCPAVSWSEVESALRSTVETIRVREINGSSADVLDYEQNSESGLNVIAIGGDKLARGLTLEGLSVSYFLRGSTMYDTLMQMGRWFGYRPGYLDLCRLFTTAELVEWYEHIAVASEELRREFDRMEAVGARPIDFGLRVRSHPALTVTSRAKMRHGTELKVSFSGDVSETTVFGTDDNTLRSNFRAVEELIGRLSSLEIPYSAGPVRKRALGRSHEWSGSHLWTGVPAEEIKEFLECFSTHEDASRANSCILAKYIRRQNQLGELTNWSVLLVGGDGVDSFSIGGIPVRTVLRQPKGGFEAVASDQRFVIRRLLNPRDEAVDIELDGYERALAQTKANPPKRRTSGASEEPKLPSGFYLRAQREPASGLLLLYPLSTRAMLVQEGRRVAHRFLKVEVPPIGMGISFPVSQRAESVSYVVNSIYADDDGTEGET